MIDHTFQVAYARVRGRHSDQAWYGLSQREITSAVYAEIRMIDRERTMMAEAGYGSGLAIAAE